MSKKMYLLIGTIMVLVAGFAAAYHSIAQTKTSSNDSIKLASLPTKMFIRGYTDDSEDLDGCFVRDSGRAVDLDAYVDITVQDSQIDLKLYTYENGIPELVDMRKGSARKGDGEWYLKYNKDKKFTVEIKREARPHLGPGPYAAYILISSTRADTGSSSNFTGSYSYRTWLKSSTPADCYH